MIKRGDYSGGELYYPDYNIAVNIEHGDVLIMNGHETHCNLPIQYNSPDATRLSVVLYTRSNILRDGQGFTKTKKKKHLELVNNIMKS